MQKNRRVVNLSADTADLTDGRKNNPWNPQNLRIDLKLET